MENDGAENDNAEPVGDQKATGDAHPIEKRMGQQPCQRRVSNPGVEKLFGVGLLPL